MKSLFGFLNSLIPFANPSRPLWHDVVYSAFLCTFLYFAPQLPFHRIWNTTTTGTPTYNRNQESLQDELNGGAYEIPEANNQVLHNIYDRASPIDEDDLDDAFQPDFQIPNELDFGADAAEPAQPVNPQQPRRQRDPNRQVGAKKAKSIARRDRIRAYNEFLREQGDLQRAQDASTAEQREKELREEKVRRAKVEAEIEKREKKKREERKEREEQARREEAERISSVLSLVTKGLQTRGTVEIEGVAKSAGRDAVWVENLLRKEGILGMAKENGTKNFTMLTSRGWIVQVDEEAIRQLYADAASYQGKTAGKVSWQEMGSLLEQILRQQHIVGPSS